ncbi:hypothetical protein D3P96_06385 [Weissella viridescens]|uniref:Uncharacterized protein n=1 Tax=Weissella viridescens TaxID=1629 RepID=A0A3P2REZ6_WEIVI|nr:hypothetical protein [Weissella viridescens]RRG17781.1 hypothetical protein D3P96_06385 [Weissella viridescens]
MYLTTIFGIITVSISLIGMALVNRHTRQHNQSDMEIARVGMTLKQFFAKYPMTTSLNLETLAAMVTDIDENEFNDILGDLREQAITILNMADANEQSQAYVKFHALYEKQRKEFAHALDAGGSYANQIKIIFVVGLVFGIMFVGMQVMPEVSFTMMHPFQWAIDTAGVLAASVMGLALIGTVGYAIVNRI